MQIDWRLNRRRFLKYAGATVAAVGASAIGLNYVPKPSSPIQNQTLTSTITSTTAVVPSGSRLNLHGRIFFNKKLNGIMDAGDSPVAGVEVKLTVKVVEEP